jgi:hypothetical protein
MNHAFGCILIPNMRPSLLTAKQISVIGCLILLAACRDNSIVVITQGDHRPSINIGNLVLVTGAVDKPSVETIDSCTAAGACAFAVFTTRYTKVQLTGKASDPVAGIKSLKLTATSGGQTLFTFSSTNTLTSSGRGPSEQGFVGSDNASSFGVLSPIEFVASNVVEVVLEATNFENNTNKLIVDYNPVDPVQAAISLEPPTINLGQKAALHVSGSPQSSWTINPPTALVPWAIEVSPPATTTYSLTVTQPFQVAKVGFPDPPPATTQKVYPTSKTVSATLTVRQPPPPVANPADLLFYLRLQPFGPATINASWAETFGVLANGAVVKIKNQNAFPIALVADGHNSDECYSTPGAAVTLAPLQTTTAAQIADLYKTATAFPRPIIACAQAGASPPQLLAVIVTYTH